jgi:hypothetical protein
VELGSSIVEVSIVQHRIQFGSQAQKYLLCAVGLFSLLCHSVYEGRFEFIEIVRLIEINRE